ncbi:hypothetical protein [Ferruginibacter sp.]
MKKLLLHIALLSYTVVMFKPVLPYVNDFVSHVLFYAHHMATVHYEHGKYHVHYDVAKETRDDQQDKPTGVVVKKDDLSSEYTCASLFSHAFFIPQIVAPYNLSSIPAVVSGSVLKFYPPPRA